jgi:hypothetical protein
MVNVLLILSIGTLCIACFFIGAKIGQKASRGENIELPHPIEAIRERQERKEKKQEADRFETIMRNIDTYDGTGSGQIDVPRR